MLRDIVGFEWRYHTRQAAFVATTLFFLLFGFTLTATGFGPDNVALNAPFLVTESLAFLSIFSVFAVAIFGSNAVVRDVEYRMQGIIYSTPVGRFHYVFGRFAGSFLAALTSASFGALGMALATYMPWQSAERIASFDVRAYLWPLVVVVLPNVLVATAMLFAIATLTRSSLATYAGAVFIWVLYFIGAALTSSPLMAASKPGATSGAWASLLDPFALSSFFEQTRYWSVAEKNTRFVALAGSFLLNRIVWIAIAGGIWAVAYRAFSFRSAAAKPPLSAREKKAAALPPHSYMLLLWMVLAGAEVHSEIFSGEYGSASYPATSLIVAALQPPLFIIGMIAIIYYGSEVFWRERRYRMSAIIEATPVSSWSIIKAKWMALVAMIAALVASGIVVGIVIQLMHGYTDFEPLVYLSLFDFAGWPLALYAAAAILIHSLSPNKYVGMVLVLMFAVVAQRAQLAGLEHHLWRFATAPAVKYTAMNGFGDYAAPFHWFMLHWTAYAALFLVIAAYRWRAVRRVTRGGRMLVASLVMLIVASGAWIFYNTDVRNTRTTASAQLDWKADYEKTYARIRSLPQPRIEAVETNVDLYPHDKRYRIAGMYALVNDTPSPIHTVYVAVRRNAREATLSMPSAKSSRDERFGISKFDVDLPPGARTQLNFDLTFAKKGFENEDQDDAIVDNGSLIMSFLAYPTIGYHRSYELGDERERRKRGLGPQKPESGTDAPVRFAATVSTSGDQSVVAPGRLEKTWTAGDRRYFRYRSDAPIFNRFAFASARYAVAKGPRGVELYYHPAHRVNVPRMLDAAALSLETFEARYGPYPHKELRIAEVPVYWPFGGFALPGEIFLVEDRAFLTDARNAAENTDLVTRRTAHEVAHQWWGHVVSPVPGPGASFLVESTTKYAELLVLEKKYGREHVRNQLAYELDRYLAGRSSEQNAEPPLAQVRDEAYVYYGKGALVLNAIRDLAGDEALTNAFRAVIAKKNPTARDFVEILCGAGNPAGPGPAGLPVPHKALIREWMNEIVLYDLKVVDARAQRRADGRYDVTVRIAAAKVRADGRGNERPLAMNESIGIGVFTKSLAVYKAMLHVGMNVLTFVADEKPSYVSVDPDLTRVDKNRFDNVKQIP